VIPFLLFLAFALPGCSPATGAVPPTPSPSPTPQRDEARQQEGPQSYQDVVPADAETDTGLFLVHRTPEKLLFEIPDSLLGKEFLVISRIARVPTEIAGFVVSGHKVHEQVWSWERQGDRVLLRKQSYQQIATDGAPIGVSVVNNNFPPVLAAFDVETVGPDSASVVLDVTELFEGDTPAIGPLSQGQRQEFGVRRLDGDRSFVVFARSFPENVDVRHTLTFEATSLPGQVPTNTLSLEMHQSMVLLPEEPMRPRYADDRLGYFSISRINFGRPTQKAAEETLIRRWRLEPSDMEAYSRGEVVEPVEPITYWIDRATPHEWRSCVRQGVEDWQPAFETAGFRRAIIARDAPTPEEDPEWDMEDVRYSVVRWAASMVRNAMGPSVSDPRSGEIIESDIVWYHNHMRSYRNRLILETGAANPLARDIPIDEGLMCEAMRQVIAHEVGHALGFPHNMMSSSSYPVDSLRNADFARRMGVSSTIMDYARQNYVAQPGDGLEGADFIRQIGPYDHYAVNWGYRVIPAAAAPEDEKPILDRWILERANDPMYRYLPQSAATANDPRNQTEDIGDDPMRASGFGVANLQRVTGNLVAWTTDPGEDYEDLAELYGELIGQWYRYMNHVVRVVGGVHVDLKTADQEGVVFDVVSRADQERAVDFLAQQVFEAPTWLNDPTILSLTGLNGFTNLSGRQASILGSLLDARRLTRLAELEVMDPADAYPLEAYLGDIRNAVFGNLAATAANPYRRALQRVWVEGMHQLMTTEPAASPFAGSTPTVSRTDVRPLVRAQLDALHGSALEAAERAHDSVSQAHLRDLAERVEAALEGEGG